VPEIGEKDFSAAHRALFSIRSERSRKRSNGAASRIGGSAVELEFGLAIGRKFDRLYIEYPRRKLHAGWEIR